VFAPCRLGQLAGPTDVACVVEDVVKWVVSDVLGVSGGGYQVRAGGRGELAEVCEDVWTRKQERDEHFVAKGEVGPCWREEEASGACNKAEEEEL